MFVRFFFQGGKTTRLFILNFTRRPTALPTPALTNLEKTFLSKLVYV